MCIVEIFFTFYHLSKWNQFIAMRSMLIVQAITKFHTHALCPVSHAHVRRNYIVVLSILSHTYTPIELSCVVNIKLLRNTGSMLFDKRTTHCCDLIGLLLNTNWHTSCAQRNLFGQNPIALDWKYKHAAYEWKIQTNFPTIQCACAWQTPKKKLFPRQMFAKFIYTRVLRQFKRFFLSSRL